MKLPPHNQRAKSAQNRHTPHNLICRLPQEFTEAAANLMHQAFDDKFSVIMGQSENDRFKTLSIIKQAINHPQCFCVIEDNQLLGLVAFQTSGNAGFLNVQLKHLKENYGLWQSLKKMLGLALLYHKPKAKEVYIEAIAVDTAARGKGTGSQLVAALIDHARTQKYEQATLQVVDTNERAFRLYQKLGFQTVKIVALKYIKKIYPWSFNKVYFMSYKIS